MEKENCNIRIKKALQLSGMKQSELCEITNIPKSAISQYLSGAFEPKQDRVYIIAKALDVSEAWLMGYDVPMKREPILNRTTESIFSADETQLIDNYRSLNEEGQDKLSEYSDDLVQSGKYKKHNKSNMEHKKYK